MLPDPTFSFTIPSVHHDDVLLKCRLYSPPPSFSHKTGNHCQIVGGAIIAHPYASLGGCYDDHVVLGLVTEILRCGFVVGTFNFRGAGGSGGRTSWTSKPEIDDYVSFVGLLAHYLDALRLPDLHEGMRNSADTPPLSPIRTGVPLTDSPGTPREQMTLVLGGYSYGSLITTHLPPYEAILERFAHVNQGSVEAEIRLRASSLAVQWNRDAQMRCEITRGRSLKAPSAHGSSRSSMSLAMGGEECEPGSRRTSRESRRSFVGVRRSLERSHIHIGRRISGEIPTLAETPRPLSPVQLKSPRICFLLVSPLLPPISSLATFFSNSSKSKSIEKDVEQKLASHPTLAVYGNKDFFTSQKKLRVWALAVRRRPSSLFHFHEVPGAGHFWREDGAEDEMRRHVREWVEDLK